MYWHTPRVYFRMFPREITEENRDYVVRSRLLILKISSLINRRILAIKKTLHVDCTVEGAQKRVH